MNDETPVCDVCAGPADQGLAYHECDACADTATDDTAASAPTLKKERDALARTVRELCGQFVNSHGRGKIICLCCDVVSDDSGPLLHEPECEVAEACSLLAKLEGGR